MVNCSEDQSAQRPSASVSALSVRQLRELVEDIMRTPVHAVFLFHAVFLLGNDVIVAFLSIEEGIEVERSDGDSLFAVETS